MNSRELHIQEARDAGTWSERYEHSLTQSKAEDLVYSEQTNALGIITSFTKVMKYQSGKSLFV